MQEFLDRRKMTEFGSLALVDDGDGDGDGIHISLPGVRRGTACLGCLGSPAFTRILTQVMRLHR